MSDQPARPRVDHPMARYVDPTTVDDRPIVIGSGESRLSGTIVVPRKKYGKKKPVPGVVLVHGAGVYDRDATIGGSKIFLDLALGLAKLGIATLRYDKRSQDPDVETDVAGILSDTSLAVEAMRSYGGIKPLFVLGHSFGGALAPAIGAREPNVSGLIVLGGAVRVHDPAADVPKASQAFFVLRGERDFESTAEDFEAWKRMLDGRPDATLKSYPDLNHLFAAGKEASTPEEYQQPATVAEAVIKDIAAWIEHVSAV